MSIFWCRGPLWGQKKASEDDVYASCHRATPDNVCLRTSHAYKTLKTKRQKDG